MPKHTMTLASARRIAIDLLNIEGEETVFAIYSSNWSRALHQEGFHSYTASNAGDVISILRNSNKSGDNKMAENIVFLSFRPLFDELMDMRQCGSDIVAALEKFKEESL